MRIRGLIIASAAVLAALAMCGAAVWASPHSGRSEGPADVELAERFDGDVTKEAVAEVAAELIGRRFPGFASGLQVRVVRMGGELKAAGTLSVRLPRLDGVPSGHTQVRLLSGDQEVGWALLYVAHYDSVAVAQGDLETDRLIGPGDLHFAWLDLTQFRGKPLLRDRFLEMGTEGELYTTRRLRAGDALRAGDLRPPFAAETGSRVVMTYRKGAISLRLSCEAREPGTRGAVVRLYNSDTRTTYKARLTGDGRADWVETL